MQELQEIPLAKAETKQAQGPEPLNNITYQWESFRAIATELVPLIVEEWDETSRDKDEIPLNPDWNSYFNRDANGLLRTFTVRNGPKLAGYIIYTIGQSPHHKQLSAFTDTYYVLKDERGKGSRLLKESSDMLLDSGVYEVLIEENLYFSEKNGNMIGRFLNKIGYKPVSIVYSKKRESKNG